MVSAWNTIQHLNFLMFWVIPSFYFLQNHTFMNILIFVHCWKYMCCIDHHPSISLITFIIFIALANWCSNFWCDILFFFDNIFFSQFQLKCHLTGISFDCNLSNKIRQAVDDFRDCQWSRKLFFSFQFVFINNSLNKWRYDSVLLL